METFLTPARLIFSPQNLWVWVSCSLFLSVMINGLAWHLRGLAGDPKPQLIEWILSFLRQGARFIYFICLPYAALLGGLIPATRAGLVPQDWLRDLTLFLPLSLGATLLLLFLRAWILRQERVDCGNPNSCSQLPSWTIQLRESIYMEIHWAFYRSAPLLVVKNRAQGIVLGLGIVAVESWLNPAWRVRWQDPGMAISALRAAALAVLMAVVFGITGNLWVTIGVHVLVEIASGWAWSRVGDRISEAE